MPEPDRLGTRLGRLDTRELRNLEALRKRLGGSALTPQAVGKTLPEAVIIGDADGRKLSSSMTGVTERAIETSIRTDPDKLATALFPIIGSAIRKAIDNTMAEMMAALNAGLERTLSFKRLGWRLESWKSGVPFMEIVLRETLRYRVERVFLIHGRTGILLAEASAQGAASADSDMVASMLEAVRAYIKDSLSLKKAEVVDSIKAGDFSLLVEEGPLATIALVIRGVADAGVRSLMRETLERLHLHFGAELKAFSGDVGPFSATGPVLARCLVKKEAGEAGSRPVYAIVALSLLLAGAGTLLVMGALAGHKRRGFEDALNAETGIVVARSTRRFGTTELRILRDPRAKSVEAVAEARGVDLSRYRIQAEAFVSPDLGDAPLPNAEPRALVIPEELLALARRLGEYRILFEQDSGELRAGQEASLRSAGEIVSEVVRLAGVYGLSASVDVVGHAAGTVQDEAGLRVSRDRARKALDLFIDINESLADYVQARGVGIREPVVPVELTEEDRVLNRSVTFKAVFR